ncbi:peptidoglycan DD-metalloendopeptidase family protein [Lutimaribacter sp. EGI FJ00015]|uniref:Peptidoglycan DD-metalloendopeptidase family protein n=1 Tax=Lutimaribacter degradans TaxID=2945989 RepID=A0ACC5ZRP1_9RHOB|nr:peptidoglycan DD-metalloendopeptidase family protein [Lutimaribacter sp. EGI FJ00013]MCM2560942.1 peptidoglycan DD-metalloendopeptidase family protein [Lutimaribacter sp. EGI FJ00013]MCO0612112.1 peptidoglycan DD-metalloendopeptidase family protein [Lutimaribacter sp. EGI FJ00015]MCO0634768.1 peptidoglycan DD-metalloendopeptidase family protein [Lutimaribacter sp. EGI FJ00014]
MTDTHPPVRLPRSRRVVLPLVATALLAGCQSPLDFDLRGNFGNAPSTAEAARQATASRPAPDDRGVISYPGYQVAIAERGDTVQDVALRVGTDGAALARYNGLRLDDKLREGEVIALPNRVAEPSTATGAPAGVDITTLAGNAIDRAGPDERAPVQAAGKDGVEPVRHQVKRGETAYTIARLYNVTVRSLAEWNGLGRDFSVREGQYLLIPVAQSQSDDTASEPVAAAAPATTTTTLDTAAPGTGSPTPTPPSASKPLPDDNEAASEPVTAATPDLGGADAATSNSGARMGYPVQGKIIRDYAQGRNEGIDIQAASGSAVKAAADGTVAAITSDANEVPIVVVKHPDNLLTVYANVSNIRVKKGDSVSRGQTIAQLRDGNANYVHFEVRDGFDSVDPNPYLN